MHLPHPELLRHGLSYGRAAAPLTLALAVAFAWASAGGDRTQAALVWGVLMAAILGLRVTLCHVLLGTAARTPRFALPLLAVTAGVEALTWAGGLLALRSDAQEILVLQFALGVGALLAAVPALTMSTRALAVFAAPIALAQAAVLATGAVPARGAVALGWAAALASALLAAHWFRRQLGEGLAARAAAERAVREQAQSMAQLKHGREQLRLALEAIDAGVSDTDLVTGERFFSARYAEILGFRDRERFLQEHRFSAALHPQDRSRVLEARRSHLDESLPFREEFRMRTASGDYVWVQARGESIRGADGRATRFVMSIVDISERRAAEQQLAHSERRYRALVEASPSLIWTCDRRGRLTFVSDRACRQLYGYDPREVIGRHVSAFLAPEVGRREFLRRFAAAFRGRPVYDVELTQRARGGATVHVVVSALPAVDEQGAVESVIGVCSDVTALKGRERELKIALGNQQAVFDAAGEGIARVREGRIEAANRALARMVGLTRDALIGRPAAQLLAQPERWQAIVDATVGSARRGQAAIHEVTVRTPDGAAAVWCQLTSRLVEGDDGDAMILVLTDITVLKRREELAWHQANHDELTGLPNRRLLVEHARRLLSVAMRQKRLAAVMLLDLDGFKEVNDVFGHAYGDALLRRVALRLSSVLREYDLLARAGGDEFVVLLPEIDQPATAIVVAEKLIAAAGESLQSTDRTLRIAASVGIALFPADGQDFDALLSRADSAMYGAKAAGKNQFRLAADASSPTPDPAQATLL